MRNKRVDESVISLINREKINVRMCLRRLNNEPTASYVAFKCSVLKEQLNPEAGFRITAGRTLESGAVIF